MLPFRIDTPFHPFRSAYRVEGRLAVGDGHEIWWAETGPETGPAVVMVHGGPGGSIRPYHLRVFHPDFRLIVFEQRGSGRSTPAGGLEANTTAHLIADMERLREARAVDRWTVVGGSWGSTLGLAYAQAHPERTAGLVVSGVFLATEREAAWMGEGLRAVFPEVFAARDAFLGPEERSQGQTALLRRIMDSDPSIAIPAATFLSHMEFQSLSLYPPLPPQDPAALDPDSAAYGRLLAHFEINRYFLEDGQLLREAGRLHGVPGAIVAGRADMCTPPQAAYDLASVWPGSRLTVVAAAGHRWNDEALAMALVPEIERVVALASA